MAQSCRDILLRAPQQMFLHLLATVDLQAQVHLLDVVAGGIGREAELLRDFRVGLPLREQQRHFPLLWRQVRMAGSTHEQELARLLAANEQSELLAAAAALAVLQSKGTNGEASPRR